MSAIAEFSLRNQLAQTRPDSHLTVYEVAPIDFDHRTLSEAERGFLETVQLRIAPVDDNLMHSTDKDALKAANHFTSFEAQRNTFLLGVHEEPLSNPADILALLMASVFFDLPTPTHFEVLDRLGPRGPKMAGILTKQSQLNVVLILHVASLAVPKSERRGGPLSLSRMAHAAKLLLQLMASVAELEQSEGAYPVSTLAELHMQLRVELEAEGTPYPSPEPIARYRLAVQCTLEQHAFRLCMLSL
eukprot:6214565-Pleurochrysis_carterae.AAC.2